MRFKYFWLLPIILLFFVFRESLAVSAPTGLQETNLLTAGRYNKPFSGGLENILWKYKTGGKISAQPIVHEKTLYLGSEDGIFSAINTDDGEIKWNIKLKGQIKCSPAVADGIVILGDDLNVYALDSDTGSSKWKFKVGTSTTSGITISAGMVFFGSNESKFYALDLSTGKKLWVFNAPTIDFSSGQTHYGNYRSRIGFSPPVVFEDRVCFTSVVEGRHQSAGSEEVYSNINCVKTATGKLIWKESRKRFIIHTAPVAGKGKIYTGGEDGLLYAFSVLIGEPRWDYDLLVSIKALLLSNVTVYSSTVDGYVFAFNANTGKVKWRYFAGEDISSLFATTEGAILFGTIDGHIHALDMKKGRHLWDFSTGGIVRLSPIILEDRLILITEESVVCFGGRGRKVAFMHGDNLPIFGILQ